MEKEFDTGKKEYEYRMPHLNKIASFLQETLNMSEGESAKSAVNYAEAIVLNRIANELKRLNDKGENTQPIFQD